jgi:hypothetical protein
MQTFVSCPDCTAPAEIIERFSLASTAGRVDHVVLFCVGGHHFRMAADMLPALAAAAHAASDQQAEGLPC